MRLALGRRGGGGAAEHRRVLAEEDGDAVEACADPDDLARGAERVELRRLVAGDAPRQHVRLPQRHGQRQRLERNQSLAEAGAAIDAVPGGNKTRVRRLLDRLDLLPERRERRAPQPPQDVGIAPLPLGAARPQLAADEPLLAFQGRQLTSGELRLDAEADGGLRGRERPAPAGEPRHQGAQRQLA